MSWGSVNLVGQFPFIAKYSIIMFDAVTTTDRVRQISIIRQRFEAAVQAGETVDGLEAWLDQVAQSDRSEIRDALELCRSETHAGSVERRLVSSDVALAFFGDSLTSFSADGRNDSLAVAECTTFDGLSLEATLGLQERLTKQRFQIGTKLLHQGEAARGLYLLMDGSVEIVDAETGQRIAVDGAGSVLGEMSLLTQQPCSADVIATSDVTAMTLSTADYDALKVAHPELEIALSQLVSDRLGGRQHDALCGKTLGGYQLVRCINRGGMGVVYEARAVDGGDPVALKMLRHRFIYDEPMKYQFDREAELLADLRHPNIVSFREHFLAYRTRFLVLDLCDGTDLFQLLFVRGRLDEPTVRSILGQIAKGLLHAHHCGVVHRDLKPSNVLVDLDGRVKLTDFGLSKLIESEALEGRGAGTPAYMPPEQFGNESVGPECDWYALGCMACEMLTGSILFGGYDWRQLYLSKQVREPSSDWPEIDASDELREIIQGALWPKAKDRRLDLQAIADWADAETMVKVRRDERL